MLLLWYAAIKDYLHLRVVGAYHLSVAFSHQLRTFFSLLQLHAQERNLFHLLVITRIGNSFKILNKFKVARFWKLHVFFGENVNVRNDCENAQKVQHLSGLLGSFFKQAVDTW